MIANVGPADLDLRVYTHVVYGSPSVAGDGTVTCTTPFAGGGDLVGETLRNRTTAHGAKMMWALTDGIGAIVGNASRSAAFIASARAALVRCGSDGMEFDYEGPGSNTEADQYTDFLVSLKKAVGSEHCVSADIAVWTAFPWVNPLRPGYATLDFLNVMTYFFSATGSISQYQDAGQTLLGWGFPLASLNLGVPYYTSKQSAWGGISGSCPDADAQLNNCSGALFVGKEMNRRIGQYTQRAKFGGVFPWQANYDTAHQNNSLVPWLAKGLHDPLPPLPPPPPPDPHTPFYIGGYIFDTRVAAAAACTKHGFPGLCRKQELVGHSNCVGGWCADWEGWWMAEAATGCGSAGFNYQSGPAGAYCCKA